MKKSHLGRLAICLVKTIKNFFDFLTNVFSYLTPNVVCKSVTIPETKNIVEMMYPLAGSVSSMHIAGQMIKGIATVLPNIVR
jgi:hypothetical protein